MVSMCFGRRIDMCAEHVDMCADMCVDVCVDVYVDKRVELCAVVLGES